MNPACPRAAHIINSETVGIGNAELLALFPRDATGTLVGAIGVAVVEEAEVVARGRGRGGGRGGRGRGRALCGQMDTFNEAYTHC